MLSFKSQSIFAILVLIAFVYFHQVQAEPKGGKKEIKEEDALPEVEDVVFAPPADPNLILNEKHRAVHLKMIGTIDSINRLAIDAINSRGSWGSSIGLAFSHGPSIVSTFLSLQKESSKLPDKIRPPSVYYLKTADELERMFDNSDRIVDSYDKNTIDIEQVKFRMNRFFKNLKRALLNSSNSVYLDWARVKFGEVRMMDEAAELYTIMKVLGYDKILSLARRLVGTIRKSGIRRKKEEEELERKAKKVGEKDRIFDRP